MIKLLEENIGSTLFDISLQHYFLDKNPQAQEIKAKINKQDYIKLKSFSQKKKATNKMKQSSTKWEKIHANDIPDKGLIFKIYM